MNKKYNVGPKQYFTYGMCNFASQLSWTMVSTYLAVFYTDVFGISTGAVAILFLVAKIWDGINDPMMGTVMERTHTRWGRFRPYIAIGSALGVAVMGWYGYTGAEAVTETVKQGIMVGVNWIPIALFVISAIPMIFYTLKEKDMVNVRKKLQERNEKAEIAAE